MSLRLRVLAALMLIGAVMTVGAITLVRTTRSNLQAQLDAQLESAGELVSTFNFSGRGSGQGAPPGGDAVRQLTTLYLGYLGANGQVQTIYAPDLNDAGTALPVLDPDEARARAEHGGGTYTVAGTVDGVRFRVRALRTGQQGVVLVALPMESVDGAVAHLVTLELVVLGVLGLVLLLVGWWVIHLGVRPVKSMTTAASAIASGDLAARVPSASPRTEAGQLSTALNQMLGRIEATFTERACTEERLRRFVADASHELRTPLATIRGYAELYRRGAFDGPAALDEAMWRTEQEAARMGALVDDLLLLAQLDDDRPLAAEPVSLDLLVTDAAGDARAREPDREVRLAVGGDATVIGDEHRLRQVLANLVANALVHTPPGTPIELRARRLGAVVEISVVDHGPGLPAHLGDRAFQRFVRGDASRSRRRGGSGLGLSIVAAIVAAHDGSVLLSTTPGGGTTATVSLPGIVEPAQPSALAASRTTVPLAQSPM